MAGVLFHSLLQNQKQCALIPCLKLFNKFSFPKIYRHLNSRFQSPNHHQIWTEFVYLRHHWSDCKKNMLDDFIEECQINVNYPLNNSEKILVLYSSVDILIKYGLISSYNSVVDILLEQLEPFPFDQAKVQEFAQKSENDLLLKDVKIEIEKQYLAWKYNTNLNSINDIYKRYEEYFNIFRSLKGLNNNISCLEKITDKVTLSEKIYYINQVPFPGNDNKKMQLNLAGLSLQSLKESYPKLVVHPYEELNYIISNLKMMHFTDEQIREGLPFLHILFFHLLKKLDFLLSDEKIVRFRNEEKFLMLFSYNVNYLKNLFHAEGVSFIELTEMKTLPKVTAKRYKAKTIFSCIKDFHEIGDDCLKKIQKHPRLQLSSCAEVFETLKFLEMFDFSMKEIEESITIALYPRSLIESALEKVESEKDVLQKYGFVNGFVPESTHLFQRGTTERRKTLQLCLYYLEKLSSFSDVLTFPRNEPDGHFPDS